MASGMVEQKEHKEYQNDIDRLFAETSFYQSELVGAMQYRKGVSRQLFLPFYMNFLNLYTQTVKSKHMQKEVDLIKRIDEWMNFKKNIDEARVIEGMKLFREWGTAMENQGIHTLTR